MSTSTNSNSSSSSKIKKQRLLFQQELQGTPEEALESARSKLLHQDTTTTTSHNSDDASGYTSLLLSEACQCSHLAQWLPHKLELSFCKSPPTTTTSTPSSQQQSLLLRHPIHALHLASQLEPDGTIVEKNVRLLGTAPWIYGEEQQRSVALSQAGIPDKFYPLTEAHVFHEFTPLNPRAPKPLHADTVVVAPSATAASVAAKTTSSSSTIASAVKTEEQNKDLKAATTTTTTNTKDSNNGKPEDNSNSKTQGSTKNLDEVRSTTPTVSFASPIAVPLQQDKQEKDDSSSPVKTPAAAATSSTTNNNNTDVDSTTPATSKKETESQDSTTDNSQKMKEESKTSESKTDDSNKMESAETPTKQGDKVQEDVEMENVKDASFSSKPKEEEGEGESTTNKSDEEKNVDETPDEKPDKPPTKESKQDESEDVKDVEMEDTANAKDDPKPSDSETRINEEDSNHKMEEESTLDDKKNGEEEAVSSDEKKSSEPKEKEGDETIDTETKDSGDSSQPAEEAQAQDKTPDDEKNKALAAEEGKDKEIQDNSTAENKVEESKDESNSEEKDKSEESKAEENTEDTTHRPEKSDADAESTAKEMGEKSSKENKDESKSDGGKDETKQEEKTPEEPKSASDVKQDSKDESESRADGDKSDKKEKDQETGDVDGKEAKVDTDKETASNQDKEGDKKEDSKPGVEDGAKTDEKPDATTSASKGSLADSSKDKPAPVSSSSVTPTAATSSSNTTTLKPVTSSSTSSTPAATSTKIHVPPSAPKYELSEPRYMEISRQEDQIKNIRALLAKRVNTTTTTTTAKKKTSKKRKSDSTSNSSSASIALQNLPGSLQYQNERAITDMSALEKEAWLEAKTSACRKVELWLEMFRSSRRLYWEEERMIQEVNTKKQKVSSSLSSWTPSAAHLRRTCHLCKNPRATGDEIMQCLECTFVGCGPSSVCHQSKGQHMLQHMFLSGHKFAVSCGMRAEVFCFSCGDFVYHKVFDQEKERLDLAAKIPWLAWNDHALQRSFDPLQFVRLQDYGIVWRGPVATYPPLVPQEHVDAARYCLQRQAVFEGHLLDVKWPLLGRQALDFAIHQSKQAPTERWKIPYPIGMYNLGNTCFMSSIVQCLINCVPLQRYFLKEIGHNHKSCKTYRRLSIKDKTATNPLASPATDDICMACEMDSLFLEYYRRSTGRDVVNILDDLAKSKLSAADTFAEISRMDEELIPKGEPIVIDKMMHVAWKSSGMNHLAGYEQRDAHEFMHAFLDILGKQICQHRARVDASIKMAQCGSPFSRQTEAVHHDVIKHLFEGTLRSVLVCEECGSKRMLSEAFLNVSLPLSKELMMSSLMSSGGANSNLSLDRCLEHFTAPEKLADPVDCPACGRKTPTKKQHTISKLPRVLCIHLKRFHAALNKKIDDFVAFPATGLNMGSHLPHWREVTTVPESKREPVKDGSTAVAPEILYDLFGTVNHVGNLQSGHYIVNLKVEDQWFSINDQHVSLGDETSVLSNSGAYILFYTRRSC